MVPQRRDARKGRAQCETATVRSFDLLVRAVDVLADTVHARVSVALVDVFRAIRPGEARCARAFVAVLQRSALGPVSAGRRGAVILQLAVLA